jgi:hypothetical protein
MARARLAEREAASAFDPYQGVMSKPASRKRDLRKVEEWLKAKRRAEELKRQEAGAAPLPDKEG